MAKQPSSDTNEQSSESPAPEVLKPQADEATPEEAKSAASSSNASSERFAKALHHNSYRPSHKATFIGLAVVIAILVVNAIIIGFVLHSQSKSKSLAANQSSVTLSTGVLNKLGVSRTSIGTTGLQLVVGPDARFNGKLQVASDVSIGGNLKLNSKFSASDASLAQLEAGNTSLSQLNVNGDGTVSSLTLRKDLTVQGLTRLQGAVTLSQILTVNNSVNVSGNLAVGGTLSVSDFHASSLTSDSTLTIGGHVITRGSAPGVGPGSALGSNGTVSISGNDAAGTIGVNIGTGASAGILANVAFRAQYGTTPHVVVSAVGGGVGSLYVSRTVGGFSVGVNSGLAPGGYAIDYIVEQ